MYWVSASAQYTNACGVRWPTDVSIVVVHKYRTIYRLFLWNVRMFAAYSSISCGEEMRTASETLCADSSDNICMWVDSILTCLTCSASACWCAYLNMLSDNKMPYCMWYSKWIGENVELFLSVFEHPLFCHVVAKHSYVSYIILMPF